MTTIDNCCSICTENLNKTTRALIKCEYCDHCACKCCYQRYILDLSQPKCMNNDCNRPWTRKFLAQTFSHSFINVTLRKHREQVLFDQERALLPATQVIVENIIKSEKIRAEMVELQTRIMEMAIEANRLLNRRNVVGAERAHFVRACPDSECRGFLSSQWKCGICEKWTCPTCHELKGLERDVEHTCHPDNVATAQLLANDTKPCPNCGTGIFKIDGCDQMWCTECRTAFSWRTGRIETRIHNPHYYEWLRRSGGGGEIAREPGDIPCGRELTNMTARHIVTTMKTRRRYIVSLQREEEIYKLCRLIVHLRYALPAVPADHEIDNQDLRVAYLRNTIDEPTFKTLLQRNDKKIQKKREINGVVQLVIQTLTDIVFRFQLEVTSNTAWNNDYSILDENRAIKEYANECFREISKTYGSKALVIDHL